MSQQAGGRGSSPLEAIEAAAGAGGMFAGLEADARAAIEAEAQWVQLRGGDTLFREGEAGDALYVLIKGRLRVLVAGLESPEPRLRAAAENGRRRSPGPRAPPPSSRARQPARSAHRRPSSIAMRYPAAMLQITRHLVERLQRTTRAAREPRLLPSPWFRWRRTRRGAVPW